MLSITSESNDEEHGTSSTPKIQVGELEQELRELFGKIADDKRQRLLEKAGEVIKQMMGPSPATFP